MQPKEIIQTAGNVPARQLNMELMRIVSMMLVLLVHACFLSIWPMRDNFFADPVKACALTYGEAVALVCVNCFILISGYFSIRPKMKSFLNLIFLVYFYKVVIFALDFCVSGFSKGHLVSAIYPFTDWFVGAYLGLYLLSPVLNKYIDTAKEKEFRTFLLIYLGIQVSFGWLLGGDYAFVDFSFMNFSNGYSVLAFVGLYCLARYIKLYGREAFGGILERWSARRFLLLFFAVAAVNAAFYIVSRLCIPNLKISVYLCQLFVKYTNPLTVLSSVLLMCFFIKLKVKENTRFAPSIIVFGKSAFAVYFIHFNYFVLPYYKQAARWLYDTLPVWGWVPAVLLFVMLVYTVCVLVDQGRIAAWQAFSRRFLSTK